MGEFFHKQWDKDPYINNQDFKWESKGPRLWETVVPRANQVRAPRRWVVGTLLSSVATGQGDPTWRKVEVFNRKKALKMFAPWIFFAGIWKSPVWEGNDFWFFPEEDSFMMKECPTIEMSGIRIGELYYHFCHHHRIIIILIITIWGLHPNPPNFSRKNDHHYFKQGTLKNCAVGESTQKIGHAASPRLSTSTFDPPRTWVPWVFSKLGPVSCCWKRIHPQRFRKCQVFYNGWFLQMWRFDSLVRVCLFLK